MSKSALMVSVHVSFQNYLQDVSQKLLLHSEYTNAATSSYMTEISVLIIPY